MKELEKHLDHKRILSFSKFIGIIIFAIIIGWILITKISLSIQAPGQVISQGYKKIVSSPIGGKIEKIYVKEGDLVKKNTPLIKLDSSENQIKLNNSKKELILLLAEKERIEAELKNKKPVFDKTIPQTIKENQLTIYTERKNNLNKSIKDLIYQIETIKHQIEALKATLNTKIKQQKLVESDLNITKKLLKENLTDISKYISLEEKSNEIKGSIKNITSQIKQKQSQIKELQNKISLLKSNYKKELLNKLQEINNKIPALESQIKLYSSLIKKSIITSPETGIIFDMKIHATGESIQPYKPLMYILPLNKPLIIEARVSPNDIDRVKIGERAEITFPSYTNPIAKPIEGKVIYVSADIIQDEKNPKIMYYKTLIEITPKGMQTLKENNFKIIPGMPAVAMIYSGNRSVISYILLPIKQLLQGAFYAN